MRLLDVDTFAFTDFFGVQPPPYAIASHRWLAGTEATWEDLQHQKNTASVGHQKVRGFAEYMKKQVPLIKWLWIDTCCIKQQSDRELSDAINSMFRWYRDAEVCLAYLEDVTTTNGVVNFEGSIWFKRGWTLQELLAPGVVIFLSKDWQVIGHKGNSGHGRSGMALQTGPSLERRIAAVTKIPVDILRDYERSRDLSTEEKMMWIADRNTTRGEDHAYCLLGILDVSMNIRYGDGREKTLTRLLGKVSKNSRLKIGKTEDRYRVPFSRKGIPLTDFFVPRAADMQRLISFFRSAALARRQQVFIVHGMGGTGKTQLCAEFAREHQEQFSAVFWLDGSSRDALRQSLASAALRLPVTTTSQLIDTPAAGTDLAQLGENFLQWLCLPDNKNWLLIFDNVDREWQSIVEDPQAYKYSEFLPQADHGSILVTTRLARLRLPKASLGLGGVEDDLAREIVESRAGKKVQDIEMLLPKLGGLPLALVQAGSYLGKTGMSVPEYVSSYEETWADLMRRQEQFPLEEYAERSLLTTWKMTYEQVKSVDELAARLLDLWAFLYHGDMWMELLLSRKGAAAQDDPPEEDSFLQASKLSLQHSVGILVQYSMVTIGVDGEYHSIHPVVYAWCAYNIKTTIAKQQLFLTALRLVAAMARTFSQEVTRETGLRLAAHAKVVARRVGISPRNLDISDECSNIANFLMQWEVSVEVEVLYLYAIKGYEKAWGPEHTSTLDTVNNLAVLYSDQGKMEEAEEMYQRALKGKEKAWGLEHTSTLNTVNNLANLYSDQGKMEEAEEMYQRALKGYEKAWGPEHTSTLDTVNNLAVLYSDQGKMEEAEEMYQRALKGYEKAWGPEHTSTLNTVNNLGNLYASQGKLQEAGEMYQRMVSTRNDLPQPLQNRVGDLRERLTALDKANSKPQGKSTSGHRERNVRQMLRRLVSR